MLSPRLIYKLHKKLNSKIVFRACTPVFISTREVSNDNKFPTSDRVFRMRMERTWATRKVLNNDRTAEFQVIEEPKSNRVFFKSPLPPLTSFTYGGIEGWLKKRQIENMKQDQRFIYSRHNTLGCDLATAHFVLCRGGRVRFRGQESWLDKSAVPMLPMRYEKGYILTEIDISGMDICYEGLDNFYGLENLKWLSLKGCPYFDDWCLDKISSIFPALEYLDVSECEKLSERGLESLYRMFNLKTLIVTNNSKSAAFELTCFMLEDCIPELKCEIKQPPEREVNEPKEVL